MARGWYAGPSPHDWPEIRGLQIHHNSIEELPGAGPTGKCDKPQASRIGINLDDAALVHGTLAYANECRVVAMPIVDHARESTLLCTSAHPDSCECRARPAEGERSTVTLPGNNPHP